MHCSSYTKDTLVHSIVAKLIAIEARSTGYWRNEVGNIDKLPLSEPFFQPLKVVCGFFSLYFS